jgi:Uma2 family endonuclease
MGEHKPDRFYQHSEYLLLEQSDLDTRYEYVDGMIYAMAGGTISHGLIMSNTLFAIKDAIRGKENDCKTFGSDVKIAVEAANSFLYPDVFVVCDNIEDKTLKDQAISNPTMIVEVLSPSTQNYDQTKKFRLYRMIPSFREYVMIDQEQAIVEVFFRRDSGTWAIRTYQGLEGDIVLQSLGLQIPVSAIYDGIKFS